MAGVIKKSSGHLPKVLVVLLIVVTQSFGYAKASESEEARVVSFSLQSYIRDVPWRDTSFCPLSCVGGGDLDTRITSTPFWSVEVSPAVRDIVKPIHALSLLALLVSLLSSKEDLGLLQR
jgi:hypothetical protein